MFQPEAGTGPCSNAIKLMTLANPPSSLPHTFSPHSARLGWQAPGKAALRCLPWLCPIPLKPIVLVSVVVPTVPGCSRIAAENHWRMAPPDPWCHHNPTGGGEERGETDLQDSHRHKDGENYLPGLQHLTSRERERERMLKMFLFTHALEFISIFQH